MPLVPNYVANGNISPARLVKIDTTYTAGVRVIAATATSSTFMGVSQRGTRYMKGTPADDGLAAIAGEDIRIHGPGEETLLELGATVVVGDRLTYSGSGGTAKAASTGDVVGAIAQQSGVSGDLILVMVTEPYTM